MIEWSMLAGFAGVNLLLAVTFVVFVYRLYEISLGLSLIGGVVLAVGMVASQAAIGAALWDFTGFEKMLSAVAAASGAAVGMVVSAVLFEPSPNRMSTSSGARQSKDEQLQRIAEQVKELE